jgi:hypothetical protein
MIELSRERRRGRRRLASGVRRLQRGCSSAVSNILSHSDKHLYYCGGATVYADSPASIRYNTPSQGS